MLMVCGMGTGPSILDSDKFSECSPYSRMFDTFVHHVSEMRHASHARFLAHVPGDVFHRWRTLGCIANRSLGADATGLLTRGYVCDGDGKNFQRCAPVRALQKSRGGPSKGRKSSGDCEGGQEIRSLYRAYGAISQASRSERPRLSACR
jgi:hypothetical protein